MAPRGRAHLSRRGWPPGPISRPAPPSGHPCCAGPPRGRPSAPSDRSPALHDRALCVHEELRGGCRVQLTPALREVHPNRTREPWAGTKGQATPAPQVPAPHLPCRLGLCTGVHGPPPTPPSSAGEPGGRLSLQGRPMWMALRGQLLSMPRSLWSRGDMRQRQEVLWFQHQTPSLWISQQAAAVPDAGVRVTARMCPPPGPVGDPRQKAGLPGVQSGTMEML